MSNKYYITGGGGLGDLIRHYLKDDKRWGKLHALKEREADCFVRAILSVHNPQVEQFLRFNPHVDEVILRPWAPDGAVVFDAEKGDCQPVSNVLNGLSWVRPEIYLADARKGSCNMSLVQDHIP